MRGKAGSQLPVSPTWGITPAHAGKRRGTQGFRKAGEDHPRACGEKKSSRGERFLCRGSPPRMRGKEPAPTEWMCAVGITPAHAGKSVQFRPRSIPARDHPRACGEKATVFMPLFPMMGSPPRMRGKAVQFSRNGKGNGITPAHAGKRTHCKTKPLKTRDHPRACGEKTKKIP